MNVKKKIVNITESAICKIYESILSSYDQYIVGIKITVTNGGCYGKKYSMEFVYKDAEFQNTDEIISLQCDKNDDTKKHNFLLVIDGCSILSIIGTVIDYSENDISKGFTFTNPQEVGRCGCGESFH